MVIRHTVNVRTRGGKLNDEYNMNAKSRLKITATIACINDCVKNLSLSS